jgi:hypothetical protein
MPAKQVEKAIVKCGMGFTINLGNYESARIDAGVEIQGDKDKMSELWLQAEKEVTDQLSKQVAILKQQLDEKTTLLGHGKGPKY